MEICRCEEYRIVAENFQTTGVCSKLPLHEILQPVPDEVFLKYVRNRITPQDARFEKAILVPNLKYMEEQKNVPKEIKNISNKWIPVSTAISLKLVNEGVGIVKAPYMYL